MVFLPLKICCFCVKGFKGRFHRIVVVMVFGLIAVTDDIYAQTLEPRAYANAPVV